MRPNAVMNLQVALALLPYHRRFANDPVHSITARLDGLQRDG